MDIVDLHGSSVLCNENMVPTSSNLCPTMTKNAEAGTKIMLLVVPRMADSVKAQKKKLLGETLLSGSGTVDLWNVPSISSL